MVLFAVLVVAVTWILGAVLLAAKDSLGEKSGLLLLPLMIVPLIAAYLSHSFSGAKGNPFKGLTWGNTSWYFLAWIAGLVVAAIAVVVAIGVGFNRIDPSMSSYLEMMAAQAAKRGAPSQQGMEMGLKIVAWGTVFGAPTVLVFFGAALGCLGTFPWYGWFFRRAMVGGRANAITLVMVLSLVTGVVGGLADNPMWADTPLWGRLLMSGVAGLAFTPAAAWVFLKTRSAVLPAMAIISFQNGLAGATPLLSIEQPLFALPSGLVGSLIALAAGIGLWVWKDPGGMDLAVAAVAHDGTPLTPEDVSRMEEEVAAPGMTPTVREGLAPPPPTPGEVEGLPPGDDRPDRSNIEQSGASGE